MLRLLITNGVQQGRAFRLRPGVNRIGRSVDNHFQIPDSSVSGSHCEVIFTNAGVLVRDLDSTNGTYIDGEILGEATLRTGQVLQVGSIELMLDEVASIQDTGAAAIMIPDLPIARPVVSGTLPDGTPACANHPELAAGYRCDHCQQTFCDACVRVIRRLGGETRVFCCICAGLCEALEPMLPVIPTDSSRRKGLFGRISDSVKHSRKHRV